jgi:hypothetical protein
MLIKRWFLGQNFDVPEEAKAMCMDENLTVKWYKEVPKFEDGQWIGKGHELGKIHESIGKYLDHAKTLVEIRERKAYVVMGVLEGDEEDEGDQWVEGVYLKREDAYSRVEYLKGIIDDLVGGDIEDALEALRETDKNCPEDRYGNELFYVVEEARLRE